MARIGSELERGEGSERTPLILFGKGNATHLEALDGCGTEGVGVDWLVELGKAARRTQGKVALQGNLDPAPLYGSPDALRGAARQALVCYSAGNGGSRAGHVFHLQLGRAPWRARGYYSV